MFPTDHTRRNDRAPYLPPIILALYCVMARNAFRLLLRSRVRVRPYRSDDGELFHRPQDREDHVNDAGLWRKYDDVGMCCRKRDCDILSVFNITIGHERCEERSDSAVEELCVPIWEFSLQYEPIFG